MEGIEAEMDAVARALAGYRFRVASEADLQKAVALALVAHNFMFREEVRLNKTDRIDFMVGRVGLELKVHGGLSDVTRQIHRYAESRKTSRVDMQGLLLVTTLRRHRGIPSEVAGMPVRVLVVA